MVDATIMPTGHKVWAEKTYSSPEINMTLFDDSGEIRVGLSVEEATAIRDSLTRELREHCAFYERIREEARFRSSNRKANKNE